MILVELKNKKTDVSMHPEQRDNSAPKNILETTHQSGMSDKVKAEQTSTTGFRATTAL